MVWPLHLLPKLRPTVWVWEQAAEAVVTRQMQGETERTLRRAPKLAPASALGLQRARARVRVLIAPSRRLPMWRAQKQRLA